ncbi:hypothetical protein FDF74_10495 [Clostridium niameyense]|uniref:Uncharacterized protein n=1 Tax=Clostridium niameyense TaxID=1622073 RepID=A0A6M0RDH4_9CLOT|nr:MazG-like family protein [Clostridium niameyense]NEZ47619.1 hypothetical protein [Clostridium niameyense]
MQLMILKNSSKLGINNELLTLENLIDKLQEEVKELKDAAEDKNNIDHIAEEAWDSLQMCIEVLDKLESKHNINLKITLNKHHKKIKEREWKAKKMIVFQVFNDYH